MELQMRRAVNLEDAWDLSCLLYATVQNLERTVEDWRKVLEAGFTLIPEELVKLAGVDISTEQPLLSTIETIGSYITELEKGFGFAL